MEKPILEIYIPKEKKSKYIFNSGGFILSGATIIMITLGSILTQEANSNFFFFCTPSIFILGLLLILFGFALFRFYSFYYKIQAFNDRIEMPSETFIQILLNRTNIIYYPDIVDIMPRYKIAEKIFFSVRSKKHGLISFYKEDFKNNDLDILEQLLKRHIENKNALQRDICHP